MTQRRANKKRNVDSRTDPLLIPMARTNKLPNEAGAAPNRIQPIRSETNRTSSAAGSGR